MGIQSVFLPPWNSCSDGKEGNFGNFPIACHIPVIPVCSLIQERMTNLFAKITNQMITNCKDVRKKNTLWTHWSIVTFVPHLMHDVGFIGFHLGPAFPVKLCLYRSVFLKVRSPNFCGRKIHWCWYRCWAPNTDKTHKMIRTRDVVVTGDCSDIDW